MHFRASSIAVSRADRLASWILGCLISLTILAGTLTPATGWQRAKGRVWCVLCDEGSAADATGNVLLFLPLGLAAALGGTAARRLLPLAAASSVGIELAQFAIPGRDPNLGDVLFNTSGAMLGWMLATTRPGRAFGGQLVRLVRGGIVPPEALRTPLTLGSAVGVSGLIVVTCLLLTRDFPDGTYFSTGRSLSLARGPLHLGGSPADRDFYIGILDEVRIFNRARTAEAIKADMLLTGAQVAAREGLVAAYDFERDSETLVADVSGHGHDGRVSQTVRVEGRFGKGRQFSGRAEDVVAIPGTRDLDLTNELTLEAWVFPTSPQRSWGTVLRKGGSGYFLSAGSGAGSLRAATGGAFGGRVETLYASDVLPLNAWSHLATTYDGTTLVLYINGQETSAIQAWSAAKVLAASVGSIGLDPLQRESAGDLQTALLEGGPIVLQFGEGAAPGALAPVVRIRDERRRNVLVVATESGDLVLRSRLLGTRLGLRTPAVRIRSVLDPLPSRNVDVSIRLDKNRYCVASAGRSWCQGPSAASGWAFFLDSTVASRWLEAIYSIAWLGVLFLVPGFFAHRPTATLIGAGLLGMSLLAVPAWLGLASVQASALLGALLGFAAGRALRLFCHRRVGLV